MTVIPQGGTPEDDTWITQATVVLVLITALCLILKAALGVSD